MKSSSAWKYALIPAVIVGTLAMLPQISLWRSAGENWAGSYAAANYDEVAYSAYVNGLVNGKPRKYDPYMGRVAEHESIFSLQFIPAYSIAFAARTLGVTTSTVFIALHLLIGLFASLSIFWLLLRITENGSVAAGGTLVVLCLGTAVTLEGAFRELVGGGLVIEYFPFLRRYQPGFGFPIFFVMCAASWFAFDTRSKHRFAWFTASGLLFAILVFSYFYLWTAALVWLFAVFAFAIIFSVDDRRTIVRGSLIVTGIAVAAIAPYLYLLSLRSRNSDEVQLLAFTREPDFTAPTIVVAIISLVAAALLHYLRRIDGRSLPALFAFAFLAVPLFVLNQQVITGRSLQPVHYEIFIANYCVLAGVVIILWLALRGVGENLRVAAVVFVALGLAAAVWGGFEAMRGVERNRGMVAVREAVFPATEFIREDSRNVNEPPVVHSANPIIASFVPTVVPARILWTPHLVAGGSVSETEAKKQFYRYLYFSGFKAVDLESALRIRWFEMLAAVFGGGRALPQLGGANHPITEEEIVAEAKLYGDFVDSGGHAIAYDPQLNYFIIPIDEEPDFTHLDRWYERDQGTIAGLFKVFRLTPRQ